jgi:uroporphyrinogen-III synthase
MAFNLHILVTRPKPYGVEQCRQLKNHGYEVSYLPTIAFAGPPDQSAFLKAIRNLGEQKWLIFVSRESVHATHAEMKRQWPVLPAAIQFVAVGEGTAKALHEVGYHVALHPQEWNSEGLLNMREFQEVHSQKIAIIRGMGGREYIDQILRARGASILPVIAYQRELPKIDVTPFYEQFKHGEIDIIICTSFEGVRNLKILLGEMTWPYMKDISLVVVSERIKILARDLGYKRIWVARNASHAAILEVITQSRLSLHKEE